jgi:hypothetical protein
LGGELVTDVMIFKRWEKKYLINAFEYEKLLSMIGHRLEPDAHGKSTICSLYLDTPDFLLIRNSIDAVSYKEKLRLRSYGAPRDDSDIFFEIKKKYKGVVYKRRVILPIKDAFDYIESGTPPIDTQIMREIDYLMKFYRQPKPDVCILCEREAYFSREDEGVRLTFDIGLRYRHGFPNEDNMGEGIPLTRPDE